MKNYLININVAYNLLILLQKSCRLWADVTWKYADYYKNVKANNQIIFRLEESSFLAIMLILFPFLLCKIAS